MAIGIPVSARLAVAYTVAAGVAGAAGALLAQTTGFASLDVFALERSADVMLMLVIGGVGWLYGGIAGAVVFKLMHDVISGITPQYWTFWIGLFLVVLVWWAASGCCGRGPGSARDRGTRVSDIVLKTEGLVKRFGGITATDNVESERHARRAPCADRPQRRRQDHADQPDDRRAGAHARAASRWTGRTSRAWRRTSACAGAWCAPSRSTSFSMRMTPLETLAMVVSQHRGAGRPLVAGRWGTTRPWPSVARSCWSSST